MKEQGQGMIVLLILLALLVGAVYIIFGEMGLANIFLEVFSYHG